MACYPIVVARALFVGVCLCLTFCLPASLDADGETRSAARQEILDLQAEIAYHDDLYYRLASPVISDVEYDALKRRLVELTREHPELSRTDSLGDDRSSGFEKASHRVPMLSLDKAYSKSGLHAFDERVRKAADGDEIEYLVEPKYDGMAISVVYEKGHLVRAVTRGDGREGDDVTENVRMISGLPVELDADVDIPDRIALRGEVYLTFETFEEINQEREAVGEEQYRSIRNLAAGSVKLSDTRSVAERNLSVVYFGYGSYEPREEAPDSQIDFYERAKEWGVPVVSRHQTVRGPSELEAAIGDIEVVRTGLPFPTDGAVVKVNRVAIQELLGSSEYAPRWALAYKFSSERVETRLTGITLQIGRTGVVTPVAEMERVEVSGSQVSRATLHNFGLIESKGIRIGDTVFVEKAGEVIPAIVGVDLGKRRPDSVPYSAPIECPSCMVALMKDGAMVRCVNAVCPAQRLERLEHFASRQGVGISGMGPARIAAWVEKGVLKTVADFYRIEETGTLAESIDASKEAELWRFVSGLSIPGIGEKRSRDLAEAFGGLQAIAGMQESDFESGGCAAELSFGELALRHFSREENRRVVEELLELGVRPRFEGAEGTLILAGKVFVLTGRLDGMTRKEATLAIENAGGVVRGSVSGRTDFLVAGDGAGSKLEDARERGIPVLSGVELLGMLE